VKSLYLLEIELKEEDKTGVVGVALIQTRSLILF